MMLSVRLLAQDTIILYGDTIRVGALEWDMQKDWRARGQRITENRELYGDHVRILLVFHKNKMLSEMAFGYNNKEQGFLKHGPARYYYDSGHLAGKRTFWEGNLEGLAEDYFKDGKLRLRAHYRNDSLQGLLESFFPDGTLEQRGRYEAGQLIGRYESWYSNGQRKWIEHYDNGLKNGIDSAFYENGRLETAIPFKDDQEDGLAKAFHRNGIPWTEWYFEEGKLRDIRFVRNKEGQSLIMGDFDQGTGWIFIYNDDSQTIAKRWYKAGVVIREKPIKD